MRWNMNCLNCRKLSKKLYENVLMAAIAICGQHVCNISH